MAKSREAAKPRNDAYTGLLAISLGALVLSCILLFIDWSNYPEARPKITPAPPPRAPEGATPLGGDRAPGEQPGGAQPGGQPMGEGQPMNPGGTQ
jgi:hypothetical protein